MYEKMLTAYLATQLTAISVGPPPTPLPVDPELKDPLTQGRNTQVAETWKVWQDFVVKYLNSTNMTGPAIPAGGSPLMAVLSALVMKIPGAAAATAALPAIISSPAATLK